MCGVALEKTITFTSGKHVRRDREKVGVSLRGVRVFHNEKHHLLISGKIVPDALFDVVHLPFFHHDRRNLSESVSDAVRDIERTLPLQQNEQLVRFIMPLQIGDRFAAEFAGIVIQKRDPPAFIVDQRPIAGAIILCYFNQVFLLKGLLLSKSCLFQTVQRCFTRPLLPCY